MNKQTNSDEIKVLIIQVQYAERTKQMEQIMNFHVPTEGLELVILHSTKL